MQEEVLGLVLAAALAPGLLGFGLSRGLGLGPTDARTLTAASAAFTFLVGLSATVATLVGGLATGGPIAATWFPPLGAYIDGLTALMGLTVSLIGAVVARYSVRYLDGDPDQARFSQWLGWTLSSVLLTIVSGNLAMTLLASIATSIGLNRLLRHKGDRPGAQAAARERALLARLGDGLLVAACVAGYAHFGSLDFAVMYERVGHAASPQAAGIALSIFAVLIVSWAITQTAQMPFHNWLPNTMEAPTPVSAFMHAGIVNAGGFLLIRMSPVLLEVPAVLWVLAIMGTSTAVFGALVMLTQTEIKAKYAWSTVSQMGFMLLQCGLGAFGAAALHLVGHSFYKGHAFLSAGSAVDPEPAVHDGHRMQRFVSAEPAPGRAMLGVVLVPALVAGTLFAIGVGLDLVSKPGSAILLVVLALAIGQIIQLGVGTVSSAKAEIRTSLTRDFALGVVALASFYLVGLALLRWVLGASIPDLGAVPPVPLPLAVAIVAAFAATMGLQAALTAGGAGLQRSPLWRAAHVHLRNGLYLGVLQARLIERIGASPGSAASALEQTLDR